MHITHNLPVFVLRVLRRFKRPSALSTLRSINVLSRVGLVACVVALMLFTPCFCSAQDAAKKDEKPRNLGRPAVRLWYPSTFLLDYMNFLRDVTKEVGLTRAERMFGPIEAQFKDLREQVEGHQTGSFLYLAKKKAANAFEALLPAANLPEIVTVQFIVIERDQFDSFVRHTTMFGGGSGKIDGEGDRRTHTITYGGGANLVDAEGNKIAPQVRQQFFRYSNGAVFFSDVEEVFTMKLPTAKELRNSSGKTDWDIYAEVDPTAVDKKTRGMAWQMVRLATQTALQQFDNEDDTSYFARRTSGEFQLNLLESLILDTDKLRVGLKYATDDEPIQMLFAIDARDRSNLAKHFGNLSRGDKRLASLRDQPSALTFATSWSIPDAGKKMVDGFFKLGRTQLEKLLGTNFEAMVAVDDLFKGFAKSLDDGSGDMVVKLARVENEFAVFGGMKLVDAERVGKSLELLLRTLPEIDGSAVRSTVDKEGRRYLSFLTEDIPFRVVKDSIDKVPGRLHFCISDETLWFCLGGDKSLKTLQDVVERAAESVNKPRRKSVQFLLDLSLNRWLADDKIDTGFSRVPHLALESVERWFHNRQVRSIQYAMDESQKARPKRKVQGADGKQTVVQPFRVTAKFKDSYLDKLLTRKQSGLRIELNATPQQIRLEAKIGLGLTKILIARAMAVQMSLMENMDERLQYRQPQIKEKPKADEL